MTTMAHSPSESTPSSPRAGLTILIALVLGVTIWMSIHRPAESPRGQPLTPPLESLPTLLAGFRTDAWFLPDDDLLGFVEIPAGPFLMGSNPTDDPEAFDNERWSVRSSQGTVQLPSYFIGRYEVTVAQFAAFIAATGFGGSIDALRDPPNHPVSSVSWPDALSYCRWLDATLRDSPLTPPALQSRLAAGWRVTLPSESEWERAARGIDNRIYPWGNQARPDRANYANESTQPVGSFLCPECPFGLRDMSGNVWEWTRSPYQPYPFDPTNDRDQLDADALWIMRGGSFTDPARNVRAAVRGGGDPGARRPFMGFRLVITRR